MKRAGIAFGLCLALTAAVYSGQLSLKFSLGGTYLMDSDYNKGIKGFRDYELKMLGADETFVDEMKMLSLGYQLGAELLFHFSSNLAAGLEVGYLGASTTSHLERTWHHYKWTVEPTLAAVPVLLNLHYYTSLGGKLGLHVTAGAGAFLTHINYVYNIEDTAYPYNGTWKPKAQTVFGAKAGAGFEYQLSGKLLLTLDVSGRFGKTKSLTGGWEGVYVGVHNSGSATLYFYDYDGFSTIGLYENPPASSHIQNVREATFTLSGVSVTIGVRIKLN